jgi:hypothetical protein
LFKSEFQLGNKERVRRLTAGDAGFHGAHSATRTPLPPGVTPTVAIAAAAVTSVPAPPPAARHVTVEGGKISTAGPTVSALIETTHPSPAYTKPRAIKTTPPLFA